MQTQEKTQNKSNIDLINIEEHQYLAFLLNNERYAIEVLQVKEIIKYVGAMYLFYLGVKSLLYRKDNE